MDKNKSLPLFVQNAMPQSDETELPYILVPNRNTGQYDRIVLQCKEKEVHGTALVGEMVDAT